MESNVDRYGVPIETTANSTTTTGLLGTRKTFAGLLCLEWVFLGISMVNILATVIMTAVRLYIIVHDDSDLSGNADFVFCILLLVNGCFCVFYVIHGIFLERDFEVYAFMAAITIVLVYCIIEYSINVNGRNDLKLGRLIVACVLAPINLIIAGLVARQFGWLEFRIVGAAEEIQNMFTQVCRFMSFLRFDFQISVSMVILVLETFQLYEKIILGVGLPLTFFWMVFGMVLVKKEWKKAVWLFVVIGLLAPAYVVFKIYDVYADISKETDLGATNNNRYIQYAILAAASMALVLRTIIFYELYGVVKHFGMGLRERAFDNEEFSENTSLLRPERTGRGYGNLRIVT